MPTTSVVPEILQKRRLRMCLSKLHNRQYWVECSGTDHSTWRE